MVICFKELISYIVYLTSLSNFIAFQKLNWIGSFRGMDGYYSSSIKCASDFYFFFLMPRSISKKHYL